VVGETTSGKRRRFRLRRGTLGKDVPAGVVLGVESVPDGLAGGLLAGVNPIYGLYGYLFGTFRRHVRTLPAPPYLGAAVRSEDRVRCRSHASAGGDVTRLPRRGGCCRGSSGVERQSDRRAGEMT